MLVDVEVLDVTEEEARKLLLAIDPLAALAQTQEQIHERLLAITPAADPALRAFWDRAAQTVFEPEPPGPSKELKEQFLILVTCRDEKERVKLLGRLRWRGWSVRRWWREGGR